MIGRILESSSAMSGILKYDNFDWSNQRWYEPSDDISRTSRFFDE